MSIFWTIYIALSFYFVALVLLISARDAWWNGFARLAWTIAFLFYLGHMIAAYHFQHHWSQADALQHAAKRTLETVGTEFSSGLYVNYVFTLVWLADVAWWWVDAAGYKHRARWMTIAIHSFLLFIAFNSTVVFGAGPIRWIGAVAMAVLAVVWFACRPRRVSNGATEPV